MSGSPPTAKQRRGAVQARGGAGGGLLRSALLEARPRLQSAYCFLQLSVDTGDAAFRLCSVQADDAGELSVSVEYRGALYEQSLQVSQRLAGLSGPVACEGHYVTLRLRLLPDRRRGSAAAELVSAAAPPAGGELWRPAAGDGRHYCVCCRRCEQPLLSGGRFRRVLPLPSDNWREMLGNVFCHGDGADAAIHERIRAQPGDCFYSEVYCVLAPGDLTGCTHRSGGATVAAADGTRTDETTRTADGGVGTNNGRTASGGVGTTNGSDNGAVGTTNGQTVGGGVGTTNGSDSGVSSLASAIPRVPVDVSESRLACGACGAAVGEKVAFGARLWHHLVTWRWTESGDSALCQRRLRPAAALRLLLTQRSLGADSPATRLLATAPRHPTLLLWLVETQLSVHVTTPGDGSAAPRTAMKILWRSCDEDAAKKHRADLQVSLLELDDVLMVTLQAELRDSAGWFPASQRRVGDDQLALLLLGPP